MKKIGVYLAAFVLMVLWSCGEKEQINPGTKGSQNNRQVTMAADIKLAYLGSWNNLGVPDYLAPYSPLDPAFVSRIVAALPEGKNVKQHSPHFLSEGKKRNIVMKHDGELWITLVNEHAGWLNTLYFYTYPKNKHPHEVTDIKLLTVIFPNISLSGSGGGLRRGDKVRLGYFRAGTVIGFSLGARGWENRLQGAYKLFTNPHLNEVHPNLKVHSVGLFDKQTGRVVVGFEDIRRDLPSCDNDFNDNTFFITPSPKHAIDISGMVEMN